MPSSTRPTLLSAGIAKRNSILCASAAARLIWAVAALVLLWTTVLWALD
jgi:hypothetical protein